MDAATETRETHATPGTARSERLQLAFAGTLWLVGAAVLAVRGVDWLGDTAYPIPLGLLGIVIGILKARFLLGPVARKAAARIRERGPAAPVAGFFSVRSWAVVLSMIALGHALRLTAIPRPFLAVLYVAVATALLVASRVYWRTHVTGWEPHG